jgi:hypothetical protein
VANIRGKRRGSGCFMTNLFVIRIPYRGTVHCLTLYILIKSQHSTCFIRNVFF